MEENKSYDECVSIIESNIRALVQQQVHDLMRDLTLYDPRYVADMCAKNFRKIMNAESKGEYNGEATMY